jgi:hypothetical protein
MRLTSAIRLNPLQHPLHLHGQPWFALSRYDALGVEPDRRDDAPLALISAIPRPASL